MVRRFSIALIILFAFYYVRTIATNRELVSIGLISFAAVAQFAPSVFLGLFWKNATKMGAIAGLLVGFLIWDITLPIPILAEYGILSKSILTQGYFGQGWLMPHALFGLEGYDQISHSAIWSLFLNFSTFIIGSLWTKQSPVEATQADYFVNINKYINQENGMGILHREAKMDDLHFLRTRFLGEDRTQFLLDNYEKKYAIDLSKTVKADAELVNYVETLLPGALGAASAKILMDSVVKEDPITLEEMLEVLDKTKEIITTNKKLEETTQQLQAANDQLKELDHLKADFVTTITHELRTPMTSIKALSKILMDNPDLPNVQHDEFLKIIVLETERITRLINQVLDIEKIQFNAYVWRNEPFNLNELINLNYKSFIPIFEEEDIDSQLIMDNNQPIEFKGDLDRITQVVGNLLSNAVKFTNTKEGYVGIHLSREKVGQFSKLRTMATGFPKTNKTLSSTVLPKFMTQNMANQRAVVWGFLLQNKLLTTIKGQLRSKARKDKALFLP